MSASSPAPTVRHLDPEKDVVFGCVHGRHNPVFLQLISDSLEGFSAAGNHSHERKEIVREIHRAIEDNGGIFWKEIDEEGAIMVMELEEPTEKIQAFLHSEMRNMKNQQHKVGVDKSDNTVHQPVSKVGRQEDDLEEAEERVQKRTLTPSTEGPTRPEETRAPPSAVAAAAPAQAPLAEPPNKDDFPQGAPTDLNSVDAANPSLIGAQGPDFEKDIIFGTKNWKGNWVSSASHRSMAASLFCDQIHDAAEGKYQKSASSSSNAEDIQKRWEASGGRFWKRKGESECYLLHEPLKEIENVVRGRRNTLAQKAKKGKPAWGTVKTPGLRFPEHLQVVIPSEDPKKSDITARKNEHQNLHSGQAWAKQEAAGLPPLQQCAPPPNILTSPNHGSHSDIVNKTRHELPRTHDGNAAVQESPGDGVEKDKGEDGNSHQSGSQFDDNPTPDGNAPARECHQTSQRQQGAMKSVLLIPKKNGGSNGEVRPDESTGRAQLGVSDSDSGGKQNSASTQPSQDNPCLTEHHQSQKPKRGAPVEHENDVSTLHQTKTAETSTLDRKPAAKETQTLPGQDEAIVTGGLNQERSHSEEAFESSTMAADGEEPNGVAAAGGGSVEQAPVHTKHEPDFDKDIILGKHQNWHNNVASAIGSYFRDLMYREAASYSGDGHPIDVAGIIQKIDDRQGQKVKFWNCAGDEYEPILDPTEKISAIVENVYSSSETQRNIRAVQQQQQQVILSHSHMMAQQQLQGIPTLPYPFNIGGQAAAALPVHAHQDQAPPSTAGNTAGRVGLDQGGDTHETGADNTPNHSLVPDPLTGMRKEWQRTEQDAEIVEDGLEKGGATAGTSYSRVTTGLGAPMGLGETVAASTIGGDPINTSGGEAVSSSSHEGDNDEIASRSSTASSSAVSVDVRAKRDPEGQHQASRQIDNNEGMAGAGVQEVLPSGMTIDASSNEEGEKNLGAIRQGEDPPEDIQTDLRKIGGDDDEEMEEELTPNETQESSQRGLRVVETEQQEIFYDAADDAQEAWVPPREEEQPAVAPRHRPAPLSQRASPYQQQEPPGDRIEERHDDTSDVALEEAEASGGERVEAQTWCSRLKCFVDRGFIRIVQTVLGEEYEIYRKRERPSNNEQEPPNRRRRLD